MLTSQGTCKNGQSQRMDQQKCHKLDPGKPFTVNGMEEDEGAINGGKRGERHNWSRARVRANHHGKKGHNRKGI